MPRKPSPFAGTTDYMAVDLESLISELVGWRDMLVRDAGTLQSLARRVADARPTARSSEIEAYAQRFATTFNDYASELDRVLGELANGVRARHIATLHTLAGHADHTQRDCVVFKNTFDPDAIGDAGHRSLVQKVYEISCQPFVDLLDLSSLVVRLQAFVEEPGERPVRPDLVNVKLTILGVEIDLKEALRRARDRVRARLLRRWLPPDGK